MCDGVDLHNTLSPALSKIELICRLSPLLDTDREQAETLGTLLDMCGDYARQLRRDLDALVDDRRAS